MENSWLKNLIQSDNIKDELENEKNIKKILEIIPEIGDMIGFMHNHPHHHLDVFNHTILALENSPKDHILRLALLLHDIGKPHSYQDEEIRHFHGHAEVSYLMSKKILERLSVDKEESDEILFLIKNHDTMIDLDNVENKDLNKYIRLLRMQYADAKAHRPDKVSKRIEVLDNIKNELLLRIKSLNKKEKSDINII